MQCSAEVNDIQHSRGEVQQITHKDIIQLTICNLIIVETTAWASCATSRMKIALRRSVVFSEIKILSLHYPLVSLCATSI